MQIEAMGRESRGVAAFNLKGEKMIGYTEFMRFSVDFGSSDPRADCILESISEAKA